MTIPFNPPDTPKYGWRGPYRGYVRVQQRANLRYHVYWRDLWRDTLFMRTYPLL